MAKMTKEEKKAKAAEKKAAAKAKRDAKKAAMLAKKQKRAEEKKAKREAKRAKLLAKREKEKAKKLALKEKKRLAKEKQKARDLAKKAKEAKKPIAAKDAVDFRAASKLMKKTLARIANDVASLDDSARAKLAKKLDYLGYVVEANGSEITAKFGIEKTKKAKVAVVKEKKPRAKKTADEPEKKAVSIDVFSLPDPVDEETKEEVELVPAGDLYGQDGHVDNGEVPNIDNDDDDFDSDDDEEDEDKDNDDDFISDGRDEQNEEIIDNRREFFGSFGEDFEPNDDN